MTPAVSCPADRLRSPRAPSSPACTGARSRRGLFVIIDEMCTPDRSTYVQAEVLLLRVEYDPGIPVLYISLSEHPPAFGPDVGPGVVAHDDTTARLVGLELLDARLPGWGGRMREIDVPDPAPPPHR